MSIKLEDIFYTYSKGTPFERQALKGVGLQVSKGEIVAVIGHTGSGKSTLIQHFNGLLSPDRGKVSVDDVDLAAEGDKSKQAKRRVGMVFQYPEHQLFAETVYDDIAFGPRNKGMSEEETDKLVREAMAFVGLSYDVYAKRSPFQLSGGQMRRVAIAGIVAFAPDYLILDEPSAGLDPRSRDAVFREVMTLHAKKGIAIILVTHSMEEAAKYAERLIVINDGVIMYDGIPAEIFRKYSLELQAAGMDIPQVFKLAQLLRSKGMDLPFNLTDADSLLRELKRIGRKASC